MDYLKLISGVVGMFTALQMSMMIRYYLDLNDIKNKNQGEALEKYLKVSLQSSVKYSLMWLAALVIVVGIQAFMVMQNSKIDFTFLYL